MFLNFYRRSSMRTLLAVVVADVPSEAEVASVEVAEAANSEAAAEASEATEAVVNSAEVVEDIAEKAKVNSEAAEDLAVVGSEGVDEEDLLEVNFKN